MLLIATAPAQKEQPPTRPGFLSYEEGDPELERGLRLHEEGASGGFILIAPLNAEATYLLDREGEVVHSWPTDSSPGGGTYLLEDGNLLRCGREDDKPAFRGGGIGGRLLDPCTYAEDGRFYLLYSVSAERGIAIARLSVPAWNAQNVNQITALSCEPYRGAPAPAPAGFRIQDHR